MHDDEAHACTGKVPHRTMWAAQTAVKQMGRIHGDLTLVAYGCRYCGRFHTGHPEKSKQKKIRYQRLLKLIDYAIAH